MQVAGEALALGRRPRAARAPAGRGQLRVARMSRAEGDHQEADRDRRRVSGAWCPRRPRSTTFATDANDRRHEQDPRRPPSAPRQADRAGDRGEGEQVATRSGRRASAPWRSPERGERARSRAASSSGGRTNGDPHVDRDERERPRRATASRRVAATRRERRASTIGIRQPERQVDRDPPAARVPRRHRSGPGAAAAGRVARLAVRPQARSGFVGSPIASRAAREGRRYRP